MEAPPHAQAPVPDARRRPGAVPPGVRRHQERAGRAQAVVRRVGRAAQEGTRGAWVCWSVRACVRVCCLRTYVLRARVSVRASVGRRVGKHFYPRSVSFDVIRWGVLNDKTHAPDDIGDSRKRTEDSRVAQRGVWWTKWCAFVASPSESHGRKRNGWVLRLHFTQRSTFFHPSRRCMIKRSPQNHK